jgi:hypothetical protein
MRFALPASVKLTLFATAFFVAAGVPFIAPVFGMQIPEPFAFLFVICLFIWPPLFIAAVWQRFRER